MQRRKTEIDLPTEKPLGHDPRLWRDGIETESHREAAPGDPRLWRDLSSPPSKKPETNVPHTEFRVSAGVTGHGAQESRTTRAAAR